MCAIWYVQLTTRAGTIKTSNVKFSWTHYCLNIYIFQLKYYELLDLTGHLYSPHTVPASQLVPIKQFICEATKYIIDAALVSLNFEKHSHVSR